MSPRAKRASTQDRGPLPPDLVRRFWAEVERELADRGLEGEPAVRAILSYRNEVESVGPMLYHRKPADVAEGVVSGGYGQAPAARRRAG